MIEHGDTIYLLAQAEPSFRRTRGGAFDEGTRRFKVRTENYLRILDRVFPAGANDEKIMKGVSGAARPGHRGMFVDFADIEQETSAEHCIVRVDYKGVLTGTKSSVEHQSGVTEQSIVPSVSGSTVISSTQIEVPVPTIIHRWVSVEGRPSDTDPGRPLTPPGTTARETALAKQYYANYLPEGLVIFEGWKLTSRATHAPGGVLVHSHWQVEDVYTFTVNRVSLSE